MGTLRILSRCPTRLCRTSAIRISDEFQAHIEVLFSARRVGKVILMILAGYVVAATRAIDLPPGGA